MLSALVSPEPLAGHILVGRAGGTVVGVGVYGYAATGCEDAQHFDVAWLHQPDKVFHDDVDTVFVEVAMVAEREEVELQAFAFHHAAVGNVADGDVGKVGLSGDGA